MFMEFSWNFSSRTGGLLPRSPRRTVRALLTHTAPHITSGSSVERNRLTQLFSLLYIVPYIACGTRHILSSPVCMAASQAKL